MRIHVYNAQTKVCRLVEANQTVHRLDFRQKRFGYVGIKFFNIAFLYFNSYLNLHVLVKHGLPRVTPPESRPSSSELDDEENIHALSVRGRK